jgi:hypothetical protein
MAREIGTMRRQLFLSALVFLVAMPCVVPAKDAPKIRKVSSLITTGGDDLRFKRIPESLVKMESRVFYLTTIAWKPVTAKAGRHKVTWRWYANGTLVSEIKQTHTFYPTPFELFAHIPATALGVGRHKAELLIDKKSFDSLEFEVTQ